MTLHHGWPQIRRSVKALLERSWTPGLLDSWTPRLLAPLELRRFPAQRHSPHTAVQGSLDEGQGQRAG